MRPRQPFFPRGELRRSLFLVETTEFLTPPFGGEEQEKSREKNRQPEAASTCRHSLSMMQQAVVHGKERDAWLIAVFMRYEKLVTHRTGREPFATGEAGRWS